MGSDREEEKGGSQGTEETQLWLSSLCAWVRAVHFILRSAEGQDSEMREFSKITL